MEEMLLELEGMDDDRDDDDVAIDELEDDVPTDDDTEEEELSDELLEIEEVLLDIDETDDEELFGFAGMAGVAGIAELLFVDGVAGVAGVVGLTGCAPDMITPIDIPPPPLPFLTMQIDALNPQKAVSEFDWTCFCVEGTIISVTFGTIIAFISFSGFGATSISFFLYLFLDSQQCLFFPFPFVVLALSPSWSEKIAA